MIILYKYFIFTEIYHTLEMAILCSSSHCIFLRENTLQFIDTTWQLGTPSWLNIIHTWTIILY